MLVGIDLRNHAITIRTCRIGVKWAELLVTIQQTQIPLLQLWDSDLECHNGLCDPTVEMLQVPIKNLRVTFMMDEGEKTGLSEQCSQ